MGAIASVLIPLGVAFVVGILSQANQTVASIQKHIDIEEARRKATEEIKVTKKKEEDMRKAMEERERRMHEEDERRLREEQERRRLREEERKQLDEEARKNKKEKRNVEKEKRLVEKRLKEMTKRIQKEDAERKVKDEKERELREEEVRAAREAHEKAVQEMERIQQELEVSKTNLNLGIQPVVWPTREEFQAVKDKLQYTNNHFHFAITGQAGSGKSSLVNAFRGLKNNDPEAASTGVTETTQCIGRYPDPNPRPPQSWIIWFDVPGAGTLNIPDWQYFNQQGLYIFDLIIVAIDVRLTKIDLSILENCKRFEVPSFIVRSKADQHINNLVKDMACDSDDEDLDEASLKVQAREQFITKTHQAHASVLRQAGLPPQRTYIVSNTNLYNIIKRGRQPRDAIDEYELIRDLVSTSSLRRTRTPPTCPRTVDIFPSFHFLIFHMQFEV